MGEWAVKAVTTTSKKWLSEEGHITNIESEVEFIAGVNLAVMVERGQLVIIIVGGIITLIQPQKHLPTQHHVPGQHHRTMRIEVSPATK